MNWEEILKGIGGIAIFVVSALHFIAFWMIVFLSSGANDKVNDVETKIDCIMKMLEELEEMKTERTKS